MNERQSERILFMRLGGVFRGEAGSNQIGVGHPVAGGGLNILSGLTKVHKKSEPF